MMMCLDCGSRLLIKKNQRYHYLESGMDNVYLTGIVIHECAKCKTIAVEIPNLRDLHLCIALQIIGQKEPLSGQQIRFLRKSLGMKAKDLAPKLGYKPEVFSRLENGKARMGDQGDRLIRIWFLAQKEKEIKRYKQCLELIEGFDQIGQGDSRGKETLVEINPLDLLIHDRRKAQPEGNKIH